MRIKTPLKENIKALTTINKFKVVITPRNQQTNKPKISQNKPQNKNSLFLIEKIKKILLSNNHNPIFLNLKLSYINLKRKQKKTFISNQLKPIYILSYLILFLLLLNTYKTNKIIITTN